MTSERDYEQIDEYGEVTNDEGTLELESAPGSGRYINIEKLYFSVYKAAVGGGGIFRIHDSDGTVIHTTNADAVKDIELDFGEQGFKLSANKGIQITVAEAENKQASVSVVLKGHISYR